MNSGNCPYCGEPLEEGRICADGGTAPYWLPRNSELTKPILSAKAVREVGGQVLGNASRFGFLQTRSALTGFCKSCNIFITFKN